MNLLWWIGRFERDRRSRAAIARRTVAVFLALVVVLGVPTQHVVAGVGGARAGISNGMIAFVGYNGAAHVDVINPDGSGFRQLVLCYRRGTICGLTSLAWSPDGRRLAFVKAISPLNCTRCYRSPEPPDESLNVINADGSGAKRLASCVRCFDGPVPALSWSPDGSRIAFSRGGSLSIVEVASGRTVRLTTCHGNAPNAYVHTVDVGCYDWSPAWSPDGSRIGFSRNRSSLDVIRANGSGMRRLVYLPRQSPARASWSPNGSRIAFVAGNRIYTVRADGSRRSLLFSAPRVGSRPFLGFGVSGPGEPFWSPDGRRILLYDQPYVPPGSPGSLITEVWVMNADGTHQRRVFHTPCCTPDAGSATWSPDSTRIAFTGFGVNPHGRDPNSFGGIDLMDIDGRHLHRLIGAETTTQFLPEIPTVAWQPRP